MNVAIWTDNDLDGAGSALALKYFFDKKNAKYFIKDVSDRELVEELPTWLDANYSSYDYIFICDIYIPKEIRNKIDKEKVIVIDHHSTHAEEKDSYKICKAIIEEATSCTKLVREKFKLTLSEEQNNLLDVVDDYDSYQLKFSDSLKLNAIYHTYNKPKTLKFIESFYDGLRPFTSLEVNSVSLYYKKYKDVIENLEIFLGEIKGYKVISSFCDLYINEASHYLLKKYNCDISIVVNLRTNSVSFRKNKSTCTLDLGKLAAILCDGGGHKYAAGGKITEAFLSFTKTLEKCTIR